MRFADGVMESRIAWVVDLLKRKPEITNSEVQQHTKKHFGQKMGVQFIKQARAKMAHERKGKETVTGMRKAGTKARANESSLPPAVDLPVPTLDLRVEVMTEHQAIDLAKIIMKRMPGLKFYHLDVDASTGKPKVTYRVTTEMNGSVKL